MPSIIINWGAQGITSNIYPSSSYVYNLTNDGFTAKHTSSNAWSYRDLIFNDADFIPKGNKLAKVIITASFYGSEEKGVYRIYKTSATVSTTDILYSATVYTSATTKTYEINADDLLVDEGVHGFKIAYYSNGLGTYYCYFSGVQFELIYEPDDMNLFISDTPVTSAYLGNTPVRIFLGDKALL